MREEITIQVEQDDTPIRGNAIASGDDAFDKKVEDEIFERLEQGDIWAWASVKVTVEVFPHGYNRGVCFSEYLGGCSYDNEAAFKKSGYYDNMVQNCRDQIIEAGLYLKGGIK